MLILIFLFIVANFYSLCNYFADIFGFPGGSDGKESACNAGDLGLIPGSGRSPGEGKGYPLQHSGLQNSGLYSPWGCKESGKTERLSLLHYIFRDSLLLD